MKTNNFLLTRISKLFLLGAMIVAVLTFSFGVPDVHAETPVTNVPNPTVTLIAATEVQNAVFESKDGNDLTVGFDLTSNAGVQPEVGYALMVFKQSKGGEGLTPRIFADNKVYDERLTLVAGSPLHKSVQYTPPASLNGDYEVWVAVFNAETSFLLGQTRVGPITFSGTGEKVSVAKCIASTQEALGQPVFVSQGLSFSVTCDIENKGDRELTITPLLRVHKGSLIGEVLSDEASQSISLAPGKSAFSFDIPAQSSAGTYVATFSFMQGDEIISNETPIPYMVDGNVGAFKNVMLDKASYVNGDVSHLALSFTAPRTNTDERTMSFSTRIRVEIADWKGVSCAEPTEQTFVNGGGVAAVKAAIMRDCKSPVVTLTLADSVGTILDQAVFRISTETQGARSSTPIFTVLVIGIALLAGFWYWKRREGGEAVPPRSPSGMTVAVLFTLIAFGGYGHAEAAVVNFQYWDHVNLNYVSSNLYVSLDKSSYVGGENMTLSTTLETTGSCCGAYLLNDKFYAPGEKGDFHTQISTVSDGVQKTIVLTPTRDFFGQVVSGTYTYTAPEIPGAHTMEVRANYKHNANGYVYDTVRTPSGTKFVEYPTYYDFQTVDTPQVMTIEQYIFEDPVYRNIFLPYEVITPNSSAALGIVVAPGLQFYGPTSTPPGGSVKLSWISTNANNCTGSVNGSVPVDIPINALGFKTGALTSDTLYSITCTGLAGLTVRKDLAVVVKCDNKAINPPLCTIFAPCVNGANNPPLCTLFDTCANGAANPPTCNDFGTCANGANNPPLCNTFDPCVNGAINPPTCNNFGTCVNGATNPPLCTTFDSCGNHVFEPSKGETPLNCPVDFLTKFIQF
ncbi:MAG: hypothetical protein ACYCZ7_00520 [Minisyncoccota bacterium]